MNVSKTIASTIAALVVAGSVGFAYAQSTSTTDPASANRTDPQSTSAMPGQAVAPNSTDGMRTPGSTTRSTSTTPSTSTAPGSSSSTTTTPSTSTDTSTSTPSTDSSTTSSEPAPQADRG